MFVNGNTLMITSARKLKSVTVEHIPSQTAEQLSKSLSKVIKLYRGGGFILRVIMTKMDFEKVEKLLRNVEVNISAAR